MEKETFREKWDRVYGYFHEIFAGYDYNEVCSDFDQALKEVREERRKESGTEQVRRATAGRKR